MAPKRLQPLKMSSGSQNNSSSQSKPKRKRKNPSRFLNAFSIAELENPPQIRFRKNRLGETEDGGKHKRCREDTDVSLHVRDKTPSTKRLKRGDKDRFGNEIEGGSDSDGNEWVAGHVHGDDDSSLDSDEAFGNEFGDEELSFQKASDSKPGQTQKTYLQSQHLGNTTRGNIDLEENMFPKTDYGSDPANEDEDFEADAIDLTAVLDQRDSESETEFNISGNSNLPKKYKASEAESKKDDKILDLSQSEPEDEGVRGSELKMLESFVSSLDTGKQSSATPGNPKDAQEAASPSEYGVNPTQKLTIADLLHTVTDGRLRKSLRSMAKDNKTKVDHGVLQRLDVPLAKRQQDKINRNIAFEKSKEALDLWMDTVQYNRRAEHLTFPLPNPDSASAKNVKKLQPVTDSAPLNNLETTVRHILVESGMVAEAGKSGEEQILENEKLGANKLPIEEVQRRRTELRKARDLLFRQEIKAKRIKKIKSKSYRKVHRKEKERNGLREHDGSLKSTLEPNEDERERMHRQRAEARMGARYRDSKWAKATKQTGRAVWDEDARAGVVELVKREEELQKRIKGKEIGRQELLEQDTESDTHSSSSGEEDQDFTPHMVAYLKSMKQDEPLLTGLSSMKFMRNAEARLEAQNDNDIEELQRLVNGEDPQSGEEESEAEGPGRRSYGPADAVTETHKHKYIRPPVEKNSESEDEIKAGPSRADALASTHSSGLSMRDNGKKYRQVPIRVQLDESTTASSESPWLSTIPKSLKNNIRSVKIAPLDSTLPNIMSPSSPSGKVSHSKSTGHSLPNTMTMNEVDSEQSNDESRRIGAISLNQHDTMVSQAFEADDTTTISFSNEKSALMDQEASHEDVPAVLPGWGSWTGHGLSKREKKHGKKVAQRTREYFRASGQNRMTEGVESNQRKDKKLSKVIISEKRVPKNARYLAGQLPHTFETKSQYERSLRMPVGPEWSTKEVYQQQTKPRVLTKGGIITAMSRPMHA